MPTHAPLQLREVFHLEFLRWLGRRIRPECYALKGGVNLRFFFRSFRYSEDMDLDIQGLKKEILKEAVLRILKSPIFQEGLKPFGIETLLPPNPATAKQTETTQRFKVHLHTARGEELFTKIEFSRRGFKGETLIEGVSNSILRPYKLPSLLVSHYDLHSSVRQKIEALASRALVQARDIFDLYLLIPQLSEGQVKKISIDPLLRKRARENIFEVGFSQFQDTVVAYLSEEEKLPYSRRAAWDEIQLKTAHFIEALK